MRYLAILLFCTQLLAYDVSLEWEHSVSGNVTGYRVYVGNDPGVYTRYESVPYQTTWTVQDLPAGTYYFAATAVANLAESQFSNEVWIKLGGVSCDVNGDASVNILDLQSMANMISGIIPPDILFDLNQDGLLNVLDLQILANVIAGIRSCP